MPVWVGCGVKLGEVYVAEVAVDDVAPTVVGGVNVTRLPLVDELAPGAVVNGPYRLNVTVPPPGRVVAAGLRPPVTFAVSEKLWPLPTTTLVADGVVLIDGGGTAVTCSEASPQLV